MLRFLWILPVAIITGFTGYFAGNYQPETSLPAPTVSVSAEATSSPTPTITTEPARSVATPKSAPAPSRSPSPSPSFTPSPTVAASTPTPAVVVSACPTYIAPRGATDARVLSRQFVHRAATPIGDGTVLFVDGDGWNNGLGKFVAIRHANDTVSIYGHLAIISVAVGQEVSTGSSIGTPGSTGRATGVVLEILVVNSFCIHADGTAVFPFGEVGVPTIPTPTYEDLHCPNISRVEDSLGNISGSGKRGIFKKGTVTSITVNVQASDPQGLPLLYRIIGINMPGNPEAEWSSAAQATFDVSGVTPGIDTASVYVQVTNRDGFGCMSTNEWDDMRTLGYDITP